ncbi:tyrosine phosphatase-like protein [Protomyces lactucae-debilis]|uniref:Very-long-chain (3R)-3-hydroxyacyl-CoA dehydratase n=1 Tax=Protomyces lactucae-debilis TaxID=2754530 RepID=A0A1Y2FQ97_PROLT|nr:tyrosine phosphatase-like protein [Protomyces lactucae-debilis]ORY86160.1 tyrosine phosphatase-like protein [Protomyces lactucae-debilis]
MPRKISTSLNHYLFFYNAAEVVMWGAILLRLFLVTRSSGYKEAHDNLSKHLIFVQSTAILEVLHVALGWVPSPLLTTATQVASRLLLVWGIDYLFPYITRESYAYSSMVVAWSITEVLRYSYYAINLRQAVPQALLWARYTLFYVLYPMGAGSEAWLVYKSLTAARAKSPLYANSLIAILFIYVPGFYFLYTYMIAQRRKMFKRQGKKPTK